MIYLQIVMKRLRKRNVNDQEALALWFQVVEQALKVEEGSRRAGARARGFDKNPWAWFVRREG